MALQNGSEICKTKQKSYENKGNVNSEQQCILTYFNLWVGLCVFSKCRGQKLWCFQPVWALISLLASAGQQQSLVWGFCQCAVTGFDCSLVEFTQPLRRTSVVDQTVSCLIMSQFASTLLLSARAPQSAGLRLRVDFSRRASSCLARSHSPQSSWFMDQCWTNNAHGVYFAMNAYRKSVQLLCVFSDYEF